MTEKEKINFYKINECGYYSTEGDKVYRFTINFIYNVVKYCEKQGKINQRELFVKQMGSVLQGIDDEYLNYEVYHYDPEELPGKLEVNDRRVFNQRMLVPFHWIEDNGNSYYVFSVMLIKILLSQFLILVIVIYS